LFGWFVMFNATFNNISVISWRSVLLVEETGGPRENHRSVASHWQTLSQCCTPRPDRDSNSQHQWWLALSCYPIVYMVIEHNILDSIYYSIHNCSRSIIKYHYWESEWLLFNAKWAMIQLYHGEKQATFNDMKMIYPLCIRPTQLIDIYNATSLKQ
jgi:hypothetical protein